MRFETHNLGLLASDLQRAGLDISEEAAKVTGLACLKIKRSAQRRVRGYPHLPHLARSFNYDVSTHGTTVIGEVGADHDRPQGKLDVFIEYGTPTSAPIPHWRPAVNKELPFWMKYLDKAGVDALKALRP